MNLYLDKIASTDDDDDGGSDDREHEGGALVSDTAHDATVAEEIVEQGPVADTSFFSLIHCQQVLMMMMMMMRMMMIYRVSQKKGNRDLTSIFSAITGSIITSSPIFGILRISAFQSTPNSCL